MTKIDLDKLAKNKGEQDYDIYFVCSRATGKAGGVVEVDIPALSGIGPELKFRIAQTAFNQSLPPVPEPVAPVVEPGPAEPQIDLDAELKRDLQIQVDEAAGRNRLEQYAVEQGLVRTSENVAKVQVWLDKNVRGYWSAAGVDAAVLNLRNDLSWTRKPAASAPPSAEPTREVLEPWQLPIDASETMMKRADVTALKDLLARRRAATGQQFIGPGKSQNRVASRF